MIVDAKIYWFRVNRQLKKKKSTYRELAAFAGIQPRTLENWIYRGNFPLVTEAYLMAKFFNVTVEFLITGKEEKKEAKVAAIRSLLTRAEEKLGEL
jgi:transcriptional regulator with XRE-family HTH domain